MPVPGETISMEKKERGREGNEKKVLGGAELARVNYG